MQQRGLKVIAGSALALWVLLPGCREDEPTPAGGVVETPPAPAVIRFVEAGEECGVSFRHEASEGQYYIVEEMGPGGAMFDADGDGDLDLYLVQGGRIYQTEIGTPQPNRFYRNEGGHFRDETEASGASDTGYGMGCAAADYDNDGDIDLYLTNVGPDVLLENDGAGRFRDVTARAGLGLADFSTSAAFVDFDHDGLLDLYVAVYIPWTPEVEYTIFDEKGQRDYRNPLAYPPGQDHLYRNRGDGTFEDVTDQAGIGNRPFYGLGVVAADFDSDGRVDIYVANDHQANFLWMNNGDGTFHEEAMERGCAYNRHGQPEASMGIVCEDIDSDGDFDLFLTHFADETNTFYRNEGGAFTDATDTSRFGATGRPETAFGAGLLDADNDGRPELFIANGAVNRVPQPLRPEHPYAERNFLLRYRDGTFDDITEESGPGLELVEMSRGAIFGDYDGDGDVDIVVCNNRGPVHVLRNENQSGNHWISIDTEGVQSNRDGIGAVVTLETASGTRHRLVSPHYSYCSSSDVRVHFGLGQETRARRVQIRWPSGLAEQWSDLRADRVHVLREGTGTAIPSAPGMAEEVPPPDEVKVPLQELEQRAEFASRQGQWLQAAAAYRELIDRVGGPEGDTARTARLLQALGNVYMALRDSTRASECFEQAHRMYVALYGSEDVGAAIALSQFGTARSREGRLEEAESAVREAVGILGRRTGEGSLYTATARRDLAAVLASGGRFDEAIEQYTLALESYMEQQGPGHPVTREISRSLEATRRAQDQIDR